MHLEILHQDEDIVAINKPHNLLVHKSRISAQDTVFALQLLRDQIGQYLYPIHRLDRKTSGVLIFGLSKSAAATVHKQIQSGEITKTYLAICRGHLPQIEMTIDYPLTNDRGKTQDAITHLKSLNQSELNLPYGKYQTSRYSLVEATPKTGRYHQIRKHLKHIFHPIIGDRPHGCSKQNKLFLKKWQMGTMLLHASELEFNHPATGESMVIKADLSDEYKRMLTTLELED